MKNGAMTRGIEILNVNKYLLFGFFPWGNLFEEKVSPNPFQNLFGLRLTVCLGLYDGEGDFLKYTVEFG
jgi:hypothetical protein